METNRKTIAQRLKSVQTDDYTLAELYYKILSDVNSLNLTDREIQLIAFTAIKGNISYASNRQEFCTKHNSSEATIYNIISKLKKIGILVKEGSKTKVNPIISLNFENDLKLEINLTHGDGQ